MSNSSLSDIILEWRRESDHYFLIGEAKISATYTDCANRLQAWLDARADADSKRLAKGFSRNSLVSQKDYEDIRNALDDNLPI